MNETLEQRVLSLIAKKRDMAPGDISIDTRLTEIGLDSLDRIDLLFDFEDEFKVEVSDEVAQELETVGQVVDSLRALDADSAGRTAE